MDHEAGRISVLGKRLSLIASIGQAAILLGAVLNQLVAYAIFSVSSRPEDFYATFNLIPALAQVAMAIVYFWVLQNLYRVGQELRRDLPISAALATSLRRLGGSILWCTALGLLLGVPHPRIIEGVPTLSYQTDIDWSIAYLGAIATVAVYAIAGVINEAVRLREDNEAII
jgi:hypothetical protein